MIDTSASAIYTACIGIDRTVFVHLTDAVEINRGVAFITHLVVTVGASTIAYNLATRCCGDLASGKWNLVQALEIFFAEIVKLSGDWKALVLFPVQNMTDAAPANVVAVRVFRDTLLISVAFLSQINVRKTQVSGRVWVFSYGTHANSVPAVGVFTNAVVGQTAVLAKVACFVASTFPFHVVCTFSALTRIGPTFRIRAQNVLALVVVLAEVTDGRCESDAFTRKVVGEYEVALEAGTNAKSGRRIGMFAVCVRRTLRINAANARCASDESLTLCPRDGGTGDKEDQLHNQ